MIMYASLLCVRAGSHYQASFEVIRQVGRACLGVGWGFGIEPAASEAIDHVGAAWESGLPKTFFVSPWLLLIELCFEHFRHWP